MQVQTRCLACLVVSGCLTPFLASAQIDPYYRELIQLGYNASIQGHAPLGAYAFYYRNMPGFYRTNLTLRLSVAPTYLDSELGIHGVFDEQTDLGLGISGGGFGDSYDEIQQGKFLPEESFVGHGGEFSASLYRCFNPGRQIPLNGVLRGSARYSVYARDSDTDDDFELPQDRGTFSLRAGLRWGGKEPTLFPSLAMELSAWYSGQFRTGAGTYGQPGEPRTVEEHSHQFWTEALLAYTFPRFQQSFLVTLSAGTTYQPDRFSAYRLGGFLPMISEFPLSLPGYYYQEITARRYVLLRGTYILPIDRGGRWNTIISGATAGVDYLPGLEQDRDWQSGVGGGVLYRTPSLELAVAYGYGIDALRSHGHGAHTIGFLMQIDLEHARTAMVSPGGLHQWRGWQRIFDVFGSTFR